MPPSKSDDEITRNLRLVFEEVASEPIPASLLDLLGRLDEPAAGEAENDAASTTAVSPTPAERSNA